MRHLKSRDFIVGLYVYAEQRQKDVSGNDRKTIDTSEVNWFDHVRDLRASF